MKNELHPIKPFPMEVAPVAPVAPVGKEPLARLEKKPSKKLVIKANDRLPDSAHSSNQKEKKITDHIPDSESVVIKHDQVVVNRREEPKKEVSKHE